jgi:hypothetical protein
MVGSKKCWESSATFKDPCALPRELPPLPNLTAVVIRVLPLMLLLLLLLLLLLCALFSGWEGAAVALGSTEG